MPPFQDTREHELPTFSPAIPMVDIDDLIRNAREAETRFRQRQSELDVMLEQTQNTLRIIGPGENPTNLGTFTLAATHVVPIDQLENFQRMTITTLEQRAGFHSGRIGLMEVPQNYFMNQSANSANALMVQNGNGARASGCWEKFKGKFGAFRRSRFWKLGAAGLVVIINIMVVSFVAAQFI